jgi:predicted DNA-binding protein
MGERRKGKHFTTAGGLVRKVVYLPPNLEDELRDLAHELRRTESDLIREAVAEHLRRLREG